jgi:hypothetical protein
MCESEPSSRERESASPQNLPEIQKAIKAVTEHVHEAQAHLLAESAKLATSGGKKEYEVELPTAYRHTVDDQGESTIERLSSIRIPLSSIVPPGVFQIDRMDVSLPVPLTAPSPVAPGRKRAGKETTHAEATLNLTYVYRPIEGVPSPVRIEDRPLLDLRVKEYEVEGEFRKRCLARAVLTARHGETGKPLSKARVHLSVEPGNVMPTRARLDDQGRLRLEMTGGCDEKGSFDTVLTVLVRGVTRTLRVSLSPE